MYTLSPYGVEPFHSDVTRHMQVIHTESHLLVNTPSDKVSNILQSTRRHNSPLLPDLYYLHLLQKNYDDAEEEGGTISLRVSLWVNTDEVITAMALQLGDMIYKIKHNGPTAMKPLVGTVISKHAKDEEESVLLDKLICAGRPLAMVVDALREDSVTIDMLPDVCKPLSIMKAGRLGAKARVFFGGVDISTLPLAQ
jgi:prophage DNA circulation protein